MPLGLNSHSMVAYIITILWFWETMLNVPKNTSPKCCMYREKLSGPRQTDLWRLELVLSSSEKALFCLSKCSDCLSIVLEWRAVPNELLWFNPLHCLTPVQPVREGGGQRLLLPNTFSYTEGSCCMAKVQEVSYMLSVWHSHRLGHPTMHWGSLEVDSLVPGDPGGLWKEGCWWRAQSCVLSSLTSPLHCSPTPLSPPCTAVWSSGAEIPLFVSWSRHTLWSLWRRGLTRWRPPVWARRRSRLPRLHPSLPAYVPSQIPSSCGFCSLPSRASQARQRPVQERDWGCPPLYGRLSWIPPGLVWVQGEELVKVLGWVCWKHCWPPLAGQHCCTSDSGREGRSRRSPRSPFGSVCLPPVQDGTSQRLWSGSGSGHWSLHTL